MNRHLPQLNRTPLGASHKPRQWLAVLALLTCAAAPSAMAQKTFVYTDQNEQVLSKVAAASVGMVVGAIADRFAQVDDLPGGFRDNTPEELAGLAAATSWGGLDSRNLSGAIKGDDFEEGDDTTEKLDWDGELTGAHFGLDAPLGEHGLAGMAVAWSKGDFEYEAERNLAVNPDISGRYELDLFGLHPYVGWRTDSVDLWATAGYSSGEVTIFRQEKNDDGTNKGKEDDRITDIEMAVFGVGGGSEISPTMRIKAEFSGGRMDVDEGADSGDNPLAAQRIEANTLKVGAEWRRWLETNSGGTLLPLVQLNIRRDGGDGRIGTATETGMGLRYRNGRVLLEGKAHALFGYGSDYEEWGVAAKFRLAPGLDEQGFSLDVLPTYGDAPLASAFAQVANFANVDDVDAEQPALRARTRLAYGFAAPGAIGGVVTPFGELILGDADSVRLGIDWVMNKQLNFNLRGERRIDSQHAEEHAIRFGGQVAF